MQKLSPTYNDGSLTMVMCRKNSKLLSSNLKTIILKETGINLSKKI